MQTSLLSRRILIIVLLILVHTCPALSVYAQGVQDSRPSPANAPIQQSQSQTTEEPSPSPALLDKTAYGLKWFFTVLVYPGVVVGIFLVLIISIVYVVQNGEGFGYVRRITGALLPPLMLTFMLLITDKGDDPIKSFFLNRNPFIYLFVGFIVGLALVEFGKRLINTDDDRWGSIYNLFLSSMLVFLLYSIMKGFLDSLVYFLFSMIMAGGLDIVFGRPMESGKLRTKTASPTILSQLGTQDKESSRVESRVYTRPEKDQR